MWLFLKMLDRLSHWIANQSERASNYINICSSTLIDKFDNRKWLTDSVTMKLKFLQSFSCSLVCQPRKLFRLKTEEICKIQHFNYFLLDPGRVEFVDIGTILRYRRVLVRYYIICIARSIVDGLVRRKLKKNRFDRSSPWKRCKN